MSWGVQRGCLRQSVGTAGARCRSRRATSTPSCSATTARARLLCAASSPWCAATSASSSSSPAATSTRSSTSSKVQKTPTASFNHHHRRRRYRPHRRRLRRHQRHCHHHHHHHIRKYHGHANRCRSFSKRAVETAAAAVRVHIRRAQCPRRAKRHPPAMVRVTDSIRPDDGSRFRTRPRPSPVHSPRQCSLLWKPQRVNSSNSNNNNNRARTNTRKSPHSNKNG